MGIILIHICTVAAQHQFSVKRHQNCAAKRSPLSLLNMLECRQTYDCSIVYRLQSMICLRFFKKWRGAGMAPSQYLK